MPVDIHLKQKLENLDNIYGGDEMYKIFGPTLMSWATIDSSRAYMFTSHLKQTLTLLQPDVPRLSSHFENAIGHYSNSVKILNGTWVVKKIIPKFSEVKSRTNQIYTIVLYNPDKDLYDIIEKPIAENLTERFGFVYNTEKIDSLSEGDVLTDEVLYKSTSFDEHMNYRYGKNARVYYSTSTDTIEDAINIRRGWAEGVNSVEVDKLQIPINDNDIMLNLYGDDNIYKPFPDIGEEVRDSLICATRRINKNHLLYDFQPAHLREVVDTDSDYYTSKHSYVYDVNVYYNGDEELTDSIFNTQLKKYYLDNKRYAEEILKECDKIKKSGSNYTQNVGYYRSRYKTYVDPEYKWKNGDSVFSHIVLELRVRSIVGLELGSKLTGRYGNKGVISRIADDHLELSEEVKMKLNLPNQNINIVDDERMPYYIQDGKRVYADIQLNSGGSIRRLNPGQLTEVEVNFIAEQVQYKIKKASTLEEKERLIFKFLEIASPKQCAYFKSHFYDNFVETKFVNGVDIRISANESREAFIHDVEENGFYITRLPHEPLLFDDIIKLYEEFPDIKPVDIYVDLFGMEERKMLRKGVIGYQYIIVLKQNSNKNFSARSTFRVNRSNLPAKDIAKKTNRSSYARTPVRLSEIYNLLASISGLDLAEYNIFMRSSALGRKSLDRILAADGNPLAIKKLKVKDNYSNANADILAARLKCMGIRINFSKNPEGHIEVYDNSHIYPFHYGSYVVYDYPYKRKFYQDLFNLFDKELKKGLMIESYRGERHDICWDNVFADEYIQKEYAEYLTDELKETMKTITKNKSNEITELINKSNSKKSTKETHSQTTRKRGRKSRAEMEEIRKLQEKLRNGENIVDEVINNENIDTEDYDDEE